MVGCSYIQQFCRVATSPASTQGGSQCRSTGEKQAPTSHNTSADKRRHNIAQHPLAVRASLLIRVRIVGEQRWNKHRSSARQARKNLIHNSAFSCNLAVKSAKQHLLLLHHGLTQKFCKINLGWSSRRMIIVHTLPSLSIDSQDQGCNVTRRRCCCFKSFINTTLSFKYYPTEGYSLIHYAIDICPLNQK